MKVPCTQCNEVFSLNDFFEAVYCDDGVVLLCSKDCKDEWTSSVEPKEGSHN
jgi:hypothetical protein